MPATENTCVFVYPSKFNPESVCSSLTNSQLDGKRPASGKTQALCWWLHRSRAQAQVLDWEPLLISEGSMSMRTFVKCTSPCIYVTVNIRRRTKTWLPVGMLQVSCGRTTRGCCKCRAVGGSLCGQLHQCPLNACVHLWNMSWLQMGTSAVTSNRQGWRHLDLAGLQELRRRNPQVLASTECSGFLTIFNHVIYIYSKIIFTVPLNTGK